MIDFQFSPSLYARSIVEVLRSESSPAPFFKCSCKASAFIGGDFVGYSKRAECLKILFTCTINVNRRHIGNIKWPSLAKTTPLSCNLFMVPFPLKTMIHTYTVTLDPEPNVARHDELTPRIIFTPRDKYMTRFIILSRTPR